MVVSPGAGMEAFVKQCLRKDDNMAAGLISTLFQKASGFTDVSAEAWLYYAVVCPTACW